MSVVFRKFSSTPKVTFRKGGRNVFFYFSLSGWGETLENNSNCFARKLKTLNLLLAMTIPVLLTFYQTSLCFMSKLKENLNMDLVRNIYSRQVLRKS